MGWRLGMNVTKRSDAIVLKYDISWQFAFNDLAEQSVFLHILDPGR